jgi:predicted DNA-binding protein YlxM (UPF0122 family)
MDPLRWAEKDKLARILLDRSHLSSETFKTLLLYYWKPDITFEELAKKLGVQRPGAWKRWKKGVDMILRSFYTIELAIYSGVLEPRVAELLLQDLSDYLSLLREGESPDRIRDKIELRMLEMLREGKISA